MAKKSAQLDRQDERSVSLRQDDRIRIVRLNLPLPAWEIFARLQLIGNSTRWGADLS